MFTQAGLNADNALVARAAIQRLGCDWKREARLVRFEPSGDFAWVGQYGQISWAERVLVVELTKLFNSQLWTCFLNEAATYVPRPLIRDLRGTTDADA